jgi:hypothetical protein
MKHRWLLQTAAVNADFSVVQPAARFAQEAGLRMLIAHSSR